MRNSCADCVRKHLSQAFILSTRLELMGGDIVPNNELGQAQLLLDEFETGDYDLHLWFAIGHIAVLENALIYLERHDDAKILRQIRIRIMEDENYLFRLHDIPTNIIYLDNKALVSYNNIQLEQRIRGHILEAIDESLKEFFEVSDFILSEYKRIISSDLSWIEFDYGGAIEFMSQIYDKKYPPLEEINIEN